MFHCVFQATNFNILRAKHTQPIIEAQGCRIRRRVPAQRSNPTFYFDAPFEPYVRIYYCCLMRMRLPKR
jgi:hypothetical protein